MNVTVYSNCDEVALYLNDVLVYKEKPFVNGNSDALQYPPATNEVTFALSGENPIKAEAGIATIVLKTKNLKSPIVLTASAKDLESDQLKISKEDK